MIRWAWVMLNIGLATLVFGSIALAAALLRRRGRIYFWCTRQWSRAILWASGTPVRTHGLERIDWSEPHVLVSNHISGYDIFAIAAVLPVPFYFIGKKELDRIPFFGFAWRAAGHISVDRSNRASAVQSLSRAAGKIRRDGGVVVVFPEGTRSRTGEMLPFKKGAFALAREARVPIIPTIVVGSDRIQKRDSMRIRPLPIHLFLGSPVPPPSDAATPDQVAARVRSAMLELQRNAHRVADGGGRGAENGAGLAP